MEYKTIIVEKNDGIAKIILNRPEKLNALNDDMTGDLLGAFTDVEQDNQVKVVLLTGAGRAFCSGADVQERFLKIVEEKKKGTYGPSPVKGYGEVACVALRNITKPVIASLNGPAIGFGCTLSLACDIRIASESAKFGLAFSRVGLMPEFGSTYFLPRLVGLAKACELVFTARIIDAKEAKEIGLVNQIVAPEELEKATLEMASSIAKMAPLSIKLAKRALYQGADLITQLHFENLGIDYLRGTKDHEEGAKAFLEKREPVFTGT